MNSEKRCIELNSVNDSTNFYSNSSLRPLNVFSVSLPPLLTYSDREVIVDNETVLYYSFCGPLVFLMKTLAQYMKIDLKMTPQSKEVFSFWEDSLDWYRMDDFPGVILFPYTPIDLIQSVRDFGFMAYKLSRFVGGLDGSVILSKTIKRNRPLMSYLDCFDYRIYISILVTSLIISLLVSLKNKSFSNYFKTFCTYLSIIAFNLVHFKHRQFKDRLISGPCLIASVLLLSVYSGLFYERLIRGQPIERLESLNQLLVNNSDWSETNLYVILGFGAFDELYTHKLKNQSSIYDKLFYRSELIDPLEIQFNPNFTKEIFKNIMTKDNVLSANRLLAYSILEQVRSLNPELIENYEEGVDYYISNTDIIEPYFLMTFKNDYPIDHLTMLNIIITRLQNSGIYDYEVKKSLQYKGFGPQYDSRSKVRSKGVEVLNMVLLEGVYYTLLILQSIAFIVLILEIIYYKIFKT